MSDTTEETLVDTEQAEKQLVKQGSDRLREQRSEGVVNPIELAKALGVRPQMLYSYIRDGRIKVDENNTQKKVIAWSEAVSFAQRYLNRKAVAAAKAAAELAAS